MSRRGLNGTRDGEDGVTARKKGQQKRTRKQNGEAGYRVKLLECRERE